MYLILQHFPRSHGSTGGFNFLRMNVLALRLRKLKFKNSMASVATVGNDLRSMGYRSHGNNRTMATVGMMFRLMVCAN